MFCAGCGSNNWAGLPDVNINGARWHKKCADKEGHPGAPWTGGVSSTGALDFCPICKSTADPSKAELIVIGGRSHHKGCYDRQNTKDYHGVAKKNIEHCPGCSAQLSREEELVVVAGKEWHKVCYQKSSGGVDAGGRRYDEALQRNIEKCPGCSSQLSNDVELIVVSGKQWHKTCWQKSGGGFESGARRYDEALQRNIERCPGCTVQLNNNTELIVVTGKQWHKTCWHKASGGIDEGGRRYQTALDKNIERCPGCTAQLGNDGELIVISGKQWHKNCWHKASGSDEGGRRYNDVLQKNTELCPQCNKVIDGKEEIIVVTGKQWHKKCHASEQAATGRKFGEIAGRNIELCPKCSKSIDSSSEKIVVAGKEWHKACYESQQANSGRKAGEIASRNIEKCPACNAPITGDTEKVVVSGKEWHKSCHAKAQGASGGASFGLAASRNQEFCPGCSKPVLITDEKVVVTGKEWHHKCYWDRK